MRLTITYPARPHRPTTHTSLVADAFGLAPDAAPHVVASDLDLPIEPGTVVAFTGPSGSGKSSLLRAAVSELEREGSLVLRPDDLPLPDAALIDALGLPFERATALLSSCGLAEPRLLLRRPAELSDGERWRFRLALALAKGPEWIAADEFTAPLDRTLAKVIAFNVRRQCDRTRTGFLIATCHEDVLDDLRPDFHVRCEHDGTVEVRSSECGTRSHDSSLRTPDSAFRTPPLPSFAPDLRVTPGAAADWPAFARWHYRSHRLGSVRFVTLLRHGEQPVGICVFTAAPLSLAGRNRFFGLSGRWTSLALRAMNRQLVSLGRVVLHPTYRGAGIAAAFVRASCALCPFPWIEALAQMGRVSPFFEKAGFVRVDAPSSRRADPDAHSALYGAPARRHAPKRRLTPETHAKSRFADPVYYVLDNRANAARLRQKGTTGHTEDTERGKEEVEPRNTRMTRKVSEDAEALLSCVSCHSWFSLPCLPCVPWFPLPFPHL